jgi:hypothetical protein
VSRQLFQYGRFQTDLDFTTFRSSIQFVDIVTDKRRVVICHGWNATELSDVEGYQLSDVDLTAERGSFGEKDLPENVEKLKI